MDFFSPLIEQAVELAAEWHDGTYRKSRWREPAFERPAGEGVRVPVIAHVTAVAMIVQRAGWDEATVAAAFLHDVIEDRNRHRHSFRREHLRRLMGDVVADRVEEVSEQKKDAEGNARSWRVRKEGYLDQVRAGTPEGAAISLADKLHNLWTMNETLARGFDIFNDGPTHRGLSAGPDEQLWFFESVLAASQTHTDPRLVPMRTQLLQEIERFRMLV